MAQYLASLHEDGWTMDDGEKRHEAYPDTYWIPDRPAREQLRNGDLAKRSFAIKLVDADGNM